MQALLAEKAFILRELDGARLSLQKLDHRRSGITVKSESFSPMKLAALLQDIARAKLAELRLSSFILMIEEKLRGILSISPLHTVAIGSAPQYAPQRRRLTSEQAFFLTLALQRAVKL